MQCVQTVHLVFVLVAFAGSIENRVVCFWSEILVLIGKYIEINYLSAVQCLMHDKVK